MKIFGYIVLGFAVVLGTWFLLARPSTPATSAFPADVKNLTFTISGESITLKNGLSEIPAAPGSVEMSTTHYFGNEATGDLNGDGVADQVFLVTQQGGGTGTFFFLVGAIQMQGGGYKGTQAVLIGDRIAPQTTEFKDGLVIVNYADRAPGEPMTAQPSMGKSLYLKYISVTNDFGEVVQNFPGESAQAIVGSVLIGPTCPVERNPPDPKCADKPYAASLTLTNADGTSIIKNFTSDSAGKFRVEVAPGTYAIRPAASAPMLPRCSPVGPIEVKSNTNTEVTITCDTGIR